MTPLNLINPQLTLTHFSPTLKTTNQILVDVKFKGRIELATYKGKLAGLLYKTIKISSPKIKESTPKLPPMTPTGMKPYMDQHFPS